MIRTPLDRTNYYNNEVTTDYNAGFQSAVASLELTYGTGSFSSPNAEKVCSSTPMCDGNQMYNYAGEGWPTCNFWVRSPPCRRQRTPPTANHHARESPHSMTSLSLCTKQTGGNIAWVSIVGIIVLLSVTVGPWYCLRIWRQRQTGEGGEVGDKTINPVSQGGL